MMALFTDLSRLGTLSAKAPYAFVLKGTEILKRLPPQYGLVINPGSAEGFDLSPAGIAGLKNRLSLSR